MIKQVTLRFDDNDFRLLSNAKEEGIINGDCKNWEEFILMKCLGKKK